MGYDPQPSARTRPSAQASLAQVNDIAAQIPRKNASEAFGRVLRRVL